MEDTAKTAEKRRGLQAASKGKQPELIKGSPEARRAAAVILEVLNGMRGPQEASEMMGISSMRYYALENRALQGMVSSLEPRPRGRQAPSPQDALTKAQQERDRLKRELFRTQALLRLVRKSCSIREPRPERKSDGRPKRKPQKRMKRLLGKLTDGKPQTEVATEQGNV